MYRAAVSTSHFEFEAYGATEDDAIQALLIGYRRHHAEYPEAERSLMRDLVIGGDVHVYLVEEGNAYRDQEPLPMKPRKAVQ